MVGYRPQGIAKTGDPNTPPFSEKAYLLVQCFSLRGMLRNYHTDRGYGGALRECRLRDAIFVLSLALAP